MASFLTGTSWRTTLLGLLIVLGSAANTGTALLKGEKVDWGDVGSHITAGIALIAAADKKAVTNQ